MLLFPSRGKCGHLSQNVFREALNAACKTVAREGVTAHALRHLGGTVTLIGMCSGAVGFGATAMDQLWALTFQAAASSAVPSPQTAKRSVITCR